MSTAVCTKHSCDSHKQQFNDEPEGVGEAPLPKGIGRGVACGRDFFRHDLLTGWERGSVPLGTNVGIRAVRSTGFNRNLRLRCSFDSA